MSVLSPALLGAVALVLLTTGASHLLHGRALRTGLDAHALVPRRLRPSVSVTLPGAELLLAAVLLAAVVGVPADPVAVARVGGVLAAMLLAAFAVYLHRVGRAHPGREVPCACGAGEAPVGPWAVGRAASLAVLAAAGASSAQGWAVADRPLPELAVATVAAVALAVVLTLLPSARDLPGGATLAGAARPAPVVGPQ